MFRHGGRCQFKHLGHRAGAPLPFPQTQQQAERQGQAAAVLASVAIGQYVSVHMAALDIQHEMQDKALAMLDDWWSPTSCAALHAAEDAARGYASTDVPDTSGPDTRDRTTEDDHG